jgi:hypothetical protein
VPILCADIDDFKHMVAGEGMAVRYYAKGDSDDLARQFIAMLQSPDLLTLMAEHNFAVGVDMTMSRVVKNYLRWFELHKHKKAIRPSLATPGQWRQWLRPLGAVDSSSAGIAQAAMSIQQADGRNYKAHIDQGRRIAHSANRPDGLVMSYVKTPNHQENGEMDQQAPLPDVHL